MIKNSIRNNVCMLFWFKLIILFLFVFHASNQYCLAVETGDSMLDVFKHSWTGDIDAIKKRRGIRILLPWSRTTYFLSGAQAKGFEYELVREYEKFFNADIDGNSVKIEFVYVPLRFPEIIPALTQGKGDIAAANLTKTTQRSENILFSDPYITGVKEILVSSADVSGIRSIDDLAGRKIVVTKGSSYYQHLQEVNLYLKNKKITPIVIEEADGLLRTEDILEMVNAGIIKYTIADSHIASLWSNVFTGIRLYPKVYVHEGGNICWAVQKGNLELIKNINLFIKKNKKGTLIGNILFNRYFKNTKWIGNPLKDKNIAKIKKLIPLFKKYSEIYNFDWLLIGAQAFQESRLDQSVKSRAGAIGIMQLLPSTAKDSKVNIPTINNLEDNIHAGVKYMAVLRDTYFANENMTPLNKVHFTLAAYNCGPGKVKRIRQKAKEKGLNPNKWFFNVEYLAPNETVRYVANIHKYYIAYKSIEKNKLS